MTIVSERDTGYHVRDVLCILPRHFVPNRGGITGHVSGGEALKAASASLTTERGLLSWKDPRRHHPRRYFRTVNEIAALQTATFLVRDGPLSCQAAGLGLPFRSWPCCIFKIGGNRGR